MIITKVDTTVKEALSLIEKSNNKTVFITDNGKLIGSLTDVMFGVS